MEWTSTKNNRNRLNLSFLYPKTKKSRLIIHRHTYESNVPFQPRSSPSENFGVCFASFLITILQPFCADYSYESHLKLISTFSDRPQICFMEGNLNFHQPAFLVRKNPLILDFFFWLSQLRLRKAIHFIRHVRLLTTCVFYGRRGSLI